MSQESINSTEEWCKHFKASSRRSRNWCTAPEGTKK